MRRRYARIALALICFLGFGVGSQAQDRFVVTVPFDFVAAGKTLPAGTYKVKRVLTNGSLEVGSYENRTTVFVLPTIFENQRSDDVKLTFTQVGDARFLTKIQAKNGIYSMPVPHFSSVVAGVKQQGMSGSGRP